MEQFLRILLPLYLVLYFGIAFVLKSVMVAKRIGKNPFVLPKDDSAYGLLGWYFKIILISMLLYVFAFALFPAVYEYFLPINQLHTITLLYVGLGFLFISLVWTVIAQAHMKNSWRIGIDTETKTELITSGLFGISRNPIFFGMILTLLGLFMVTPNGVTGLFLVLGYVLIQVQIRLEEEFLTHEHGQKYLDYKKNVRRLL